MTLEGLLAGAAAVLSAALGGVVLLRQPRSFAHRAFAAGMYALALEAVCAGASAEARSESSFLRWLELGLGAQALLLGPWLLFSLSFARAGYQTFVARWRFMVGAAFAVPLALAVLFHGSLLSGVAVDERGLLPTLGWSGYALQVALLLGAVFVLANLERTLRASSGSMRWLIKFMLLGVGGLFAFRVFTSSQALLYRVLDPDLQTLNSGAVILADVLVVVSLVRTRLRAVDLYLSQSALYSSVVLILVGVYLVGIGLVAKAVTWLGGSKSLPAAAFVGFVGTLALAVLLLSDELRQRTRRLVSRHFERPRYDYREEWLRFTASTSSLVDVRALSAAVARRVAETLNVPSASVWLLEDGGGFALGGSTVHSAADGETLARDPQALRAILAGLGPRRDPARLPAPPEALAPGDPRAELRSAVALCAGGDTVGLLTLSDRPDGQPLTAEDLDLLKTLADQAAASLLGLRLAERLVRAREMEAFQAVSAFFVHDLKNLASKLSLTLQNLPARYDDPAFRADLLGVISRSVGKINDMCSRLSPLGRRLEMRGAASDLNEVVLGALAGLNGALRGTLVQDLHPVPSAVIDAEQMQKVLLNLVLNASEATEGGGEIRVSTGERDGWVCLAVADDGVGMSAEAVGSLFQPFKTTKPQGLGIGLYHAREIVAAHRGRIEVESAPGRGSTFRVLLPAARDRGEANR